MDSRFPILAALELLQSNCPWVTNPEWIGRGSTRALHAGGKYRIQQPLLLSVSFYVHPILAIPIDIPYGTGSRPYTVVLGEKSTSPLFLRQ